MKKSDVGYAVVVDREGVYHSLDLQVLVRSEWSRKFEIVAKIYYQANNASPLEWYGHRIETWNARDVPELKIAYEATAKLVGDTDLTCVDKLFTNMATFTRCVYDKRISNYVEVEGLYDDDYTAWFDNYKSTGYCTVRVMARDKDEAQRLITEDMAKNGYHTQLVAWIEAGRPVRFNTSHAPNVVSMESLLPQKEEALEIA